MADSIIPSTVPGDVTTNDKRRFRVIPLRTEHVDRAGIGELIVDRENGDIYVINDAGEPVCRTKNLEDIVTNNITSDLNSLFYMNNRNRRVYRLFFNNDMLRLDTNLILDDENYYYRVRDIEDNGRYYVANLTKIKEPAPVLYPLVDNQIYFVELYNRNKEMISMLQFSAKAALYFDVDDEPVTAVSHIEIYTNKSFMYQGEDIDSLLIKLYAVYEDGVKKEITNASTVSITHNIDPTTIGEYEISANWIYDIDNDLSMDVVKQFNIVEDKTATIVDMVVIPRKIIRLNDGTKEIRLTVIVYYGDGSSEDVSDRVVISNFDDELFNEPQLIDVKLNAGVVNVWEKAYTIEVNDSGAASDYKLLFNDDNILKLDESNRDTYPLDTAYYKVRNANDLDFFFTPDFAELHYSAIFMESNDYKLATATNVIVEFYDNNYRLLDSDVYTCEFKADLTSYTITNCNKIMYVAENTNVFKEPILTSGSFGTVDINDTVSVTGIVDNGWYRIAYESYIGFVPQTTLSDTEVDVTDGREEVITVINDSLSYVYPDYAYTTDFEITREDDSLTVTGEYSEVGKDMMNDFARLLGSFYRSNNGQVVNEIIYGDTTYRWDTNGVLLGSNWVDETGNTLVSKVVTVIQTIRPDSITLRINHVNVTFKFVVVASK